MDHFYRDIEGWAAFSDLYVEAVKNAKNGDMFVEVGSWLGKSAAFMGVEIINSGKNIYFTCVDPWLDGGPDLRDTVYFKKQSSDLYGIFKRNTAPVSKVIDTLKMTSVEASTQFADDSVDFIMLDGDHCYEAVRDDIEVWLPKMKPGSVMSGDDYLWPGVTQAVQEAFGGLTKIVVKRPHPNYLNSASFWSVQL